MNRFLHIGKPQNLFASLILLLLVLHTTTSCTSENPRPVSDPAKTLSLRFLEKLDLPLGSFKEHFNTAGLAADANSFQFGSQSQTLPNKEKQPESSRQFSSDAAVKPIWNTIEGIWKYELLVIDKQSLRVSQVITALIILLIGLRFTRGLTRLFHRRILSRLHLSASASATTEKLLYYTALLLVILLALRIVKIPLTAFAFLGGAIAIGVGFGAQKLIGNFISGFIIMAEKPIKVGDLVQMDNELGWIEDIGVRSTRVRTFSNTHILVPNSYFLENSITNWTHNDNVVRCQITVGVIYGSPTQQVKELLLEAALANSFVLHQPEPYVWFTDFGDNSLVFNLFFWISVTNVVGRQKTESEVRFTIDQLFRDHGIVIAFPQQDLHLDVKHPLQLEITESDSKKKNKNG